jgi:hypothetical protein
VRGQPFFQLDARVTKNFRIRERANLQAIFQVFDLTNRANFGSNFVNDVRLASFGTPSNFITPSGVTALQTVILAAIVRSEGVGFASEVRTSHLETVSTVRGSGWVKGSLFIIIAIRFSGRQPIRYRGRY